MDESLPIEREREPSLGTISASCVQRQIVWLGLFASCSRAVSEIHPRLKPEILNRVTSPSSSASKAGCQCRSRTISRNGKYKYMCAEHDLGIKLFDGAAQIRERDLANRPCSSYSVRTRT